MWLESITLRMGRINWRKVNEKYVAYVENCMLGVMRLKLKSFKHDWLPHSVVVVIFKRCKS